jgi:sulfite reductase (ferredoxin)
LSDVRPVKETPAQRAERIKGAKVPYDLWDDIQRWAREGRDFLAIPPEDLNSRLRWWGLYTQGDGQGVHSRAKGRAEGKALPFFMMRIKLPNGHLRSHQLRTIGTIANRCARGFGDVTVRENIQLHWIRIEDVPDIITQLNLVGVTTLGA